MLGRENSKSNNLQNFFFFYLPFPFLYVMSVYVFGLCSVKEINIFPVLFSSCARMRWWGHTDDDDDVCELEYLSKHDGAYENDIKMRTRWYWESATPWLIEKCVVPLRISPTVSLYFNVEIFSVLGKPFGIQHWEWCLHRETIELETEKGFWQKFFSFSLRFIIINSDIHATASWNSFWQRTHLSIDCA